MFAITVKKDKEEYEIICGLDIPAGIILKNEKGEDYEVLGGYYVESVAIEMDEIERALKKSFGLFPIDPED